MQQGPGEGELLEEQDRVDVGGDVEEGSDSHEGQPFVIVTVTGNTAP